MVAPVWAEEVNAYPIIARKVRAVQRRVSIRVIRAYRTVLLKLAFGEPSGRAPGRENEGRLHEEEGSNPQ